MASLVVQINISSGGVPKRGIEQAHITGEGLEGDAVAHPQYHGGPRQAVLLITSEGIEELVAEGYPLYPGALGENLTTRGLDRRSLRKGQRFRVGDVLIELTKVRWPCATLKVYHAELPTSLEAREPTSQRWGLSGFYASVVEEGTVRTGDPIALTD